MISRLYVRLYLSLRDRWLILIVCGSALSLVVSIVLTIVRREDASLEGWLAPLFFWVWTIAGVAWSVKELLTKGKELQALKVGIEFDRSSFDNFLTNVTLHESLLDAGYVILRGGVGKNVITGDRFIGASAVSARVNRLLWDMPAPEFEVRVGRDAGPRILGLVRLARPERLSNLAARWLAALGNAFSCQWRNEDRWPQRVRLTLRRMFLRYKVWPLPSRLDALIFPTVQAVTKEKRTLANESKIRLCTDLLTDGPISGVTIQPTDYLSDLVTGQITGMLFRDADGHLLYNGYELAFSRESATWVLKPCNESECSNQLGASCLLVVVSRREGRLSGRLCIVNQALGNVQSAGLLAPSGSGSLDWSDYLGYGRSFVYSGMMRELLEETTDGNWWELGRQASIVLTGFGRMIHRGGKPEFYGLVLMPGSSHRLGIDRSEQEFVKDFETLDIYPLCAHNLCAALERYAAENQQRLSHPLFVAIRLATSYLTERSVAFDAHVAETFGAAGPPGRCEELVTKP